MTNYGQRITDVLNEDITLNTILTGSVFFYPESGRKGINRIQVPLAYDKVKGLLKPTAIVLELDETPDYQAVDGAGIYMSTVTPEVIFIYDHGDAGYGQIELAYDRIYQLLNARQIAGAFQMFWTNTVKYKRQPDMLDACFFRVDFKVHGFRSNA
jgi:hypothetical protein